MSAYVTRRLLHLLRIALAPPVPPAGFGAVRHLQPSPRYQTYLLTIWGYQQLTGLAGILLVLFADQLIAWWDILDFLRWMIVAEEIGQQFLPGILAPLLVVAGIAGYLLQFCGSLAAIWLKLRTRFYLVGSEGLLIREGVRQIHELTIRFSNIQQVSIKQNPLQRVFGIADVEVRTAGGDGKAAAGESGIGAHSGHVAVLRHVDDPRGVRDLIRGQAGRSADRDDGAPEAPHLPKQHDIIAAAEELLGEARRLRRAITTREHAG